MKRREMLCIGLSAVIAAGSVGACGGTSARTLFDVGSGGGAPGNVGSSASGGTVTSMNGTGGGAPVDFGGFDSGGEIGRTETSGSGGFGFSSDAGAVRDSGIASSSGEPSREHAADAAIRPPGAHRVSCGNTICNLDAGEVCCATLGASGLNVACVSSAASCTTRYSCDADNDCPRGQTCCAPPNAIGLSGLACAADCPSTQVPVHCTETSDCGGGVCCATLIVLPGGLDATAFTCRAACSTTESPMCDATTACTGGRRCQSTAAIPGGHLVCL